MGNGVIAFMISAGAATWIYTKFMRSTGGNTKNAVIASAVAGLAIFGLAMYLLSLIPK